MSKLTDNLSVKDIALIGGGITLIVLVKKYGPSVETVKEIASDTVDEAGKVLNLEQDNYFNRTFNKAVEALTGYDSLASFAWAIFHPDETGV